jgi:hypothetical protein
MRSFHNLLGRLTFYNSGELMVDKQSLVFALMVIWMIGWSWYKFLMLLMHVVLCVWCFLQKEIMGMVTVVFFGVE